MSNNQVGDLYNKVIQAVVEASQVDFEEGGVDQKALEILRQTWQKKLSSLGVAHFPWDPAPVTAARQDSSYLPNSQSVDRKGQQPLQNNGSSFPTPSSYDSSSSPRLKQDPGFPSANGQPNPYPMVQANPASIAAMTAQERAARQLQSRYGEQAAAQIRQLQQQGVVASTIPSGQQRQGTSVPNYENKIKQEPTSEFDPVPQPQPTIKADQTDGAGDDLDQWRSEVEKRRAFVELHPGEGDRLIHQHVLEKQKQLEGGGLFIPVEERQHPRAALKRKVDALVATSGDVEGSLRIDEPSRAQLDGPGDDEDVKPDLDEDENAINSELDDPDELAEDPDEDEEHGQSMFCTYDKVQRVKNKWKCTMKDGILTAGGKEYVFGKGQGEFEW